MYFDEFPLDDTVLDALDDMNFEECTPIQERTMAPILEGHDLIGIAQTGTGKTAAYLLPILNQLITGHYPKDSINCIVMSPTRELAQQIDRQVEGFSYFMPISSVAVYGGNDGSRFEQERKGLILGADIIIATPGRLISHIASGHVDLSKVSFFVLDEADRMLDMGFFDDIMKIVRYLPKQRQTIMFSATMPTNIQKLANKILNNPVEVKIAVSKPAEKIKQIAYLCYDEMKDNILRTILTTEDLDKVIVFVSKKSKVKELVHSIKLKGRNIGGMHSDLTQQERDDIMYNFRNERIQVLIATDIISRGIDIDDIQLVINYDVPHDPEDYVHRIGRTARANRNGQAITLVSPHDMYFLNKIEKLIEKEIDKPELPKGCGKKPTFLEENLTKTDKNNSFPKSNQRGKKHKINNIKNSQVNGNSKTNTANIHSDETGNRYRKYNRQGRSVRKSKNCGNQSSQDSQST